MIRFNRPYITGRELGYMAEAMEKGHLSGDGPFTARCQAIFRERFGFLHNYLTTSCTDALEMSAILANIGPGDEVIVPSFTFVSTANAFILRGAKVVFVDSLPDHPNMDVRAVEALITPRTKAILAMHYGGIACDMDMLMPLVRKHGLILVEDAAQAIDSYYRGQPLGSFGHLAAFSFHETKNIHAGEGGLLVVQGEFAHRSEIIRDKGTDRSAFFRGEVDKYGWVDIGSSFLASELIAAFLFAQLAELDTIQRERKRVWEFYHARLQPLKAAGYRLPHVPEHCTNNAHLYHLICPSLERRTALIAHLNAKGIRAVFHYQALHASAYHRAHHPQQVPLPWSEHYGDTLVRLPLFAGLTDAEMQHVAEQVLAFEGL
ncbi:MAG TPA: dTDP-4-amino-4,6-dideoxygalactose transaminase [Flavobacteriales bacterium]